MIVNNTQELRERAGYFEPLELGEVEVPDLIYLLQLIRGLDSLEVETLPVVELQEAISTASYFDFRAELKTLVDEFLWRIGSRHKSLERYLRSVGTERYIVYYSTRRGHRAVPYYRHRHASVYSIRRDIEPRTLRDALVSVYPKPFVGVTVGIRTGSGDSLSIAHFGNLRLTKWYYGRHKQLGCRFAQNTVNVDCLRYAQERGVNIAKFPIHTSNLECEKHLLEAGAVFVFDTDCDITVGVAIYRSDLKALKRIFERHPCRFNRQVLYTLVSDIEIYRFMIQHTDLEILKQTVIDVAARLGVPGVEVALKHGIEISDLSQAEILLSSSEVIAYLYGLGMRWPKEYFNWHTIYMSMDAIEKLTELGHQWDSGATENCISAHDPKRFRYLNSIAPIKRDTAHDYIFSFGIEKLKTLYEGGCVHVQKGNLPRRPDYASRQHLDYIHKHIDPDY